ncbi:tetratricopeptide repeat protein [Candidatus Colwellia aromaticivorans]|uniref:tetratricopeptide repeat protein n=1 Tax=Candidatus Colwellia aromaticivorans TaxID=2267621 RepID=UPI001B34D81F|nr:hypothetical protein [Candidatus Colwellia aromaticivorans]
MVVNKMADKIKVTKALLNQHKKALWSLIVASSILLIALSPNAFIDLWLTKNQQGQLLFNSARYNQASRTFTNSHWQAFSAYGNEDYQSAATLYSQFNDKQSLLAQANALAHGREYIKARNLYQKIINKYPNYLAAQTNIKIIQAIIDEVNLLSESQKSEQGESIKELGDEPQTGDGAEKKEARAPEFEQLSSDELLLDENLNKMWLRQVQKDPASFLSQKFYFQFEQTKSSKEKVNE